LEELHETAESYHPWITFETLFIKNSNLEERKKKTFPLFMFVFLAVSEYNRGLNAVSKDGVTFFKSPGSSTPYALL
jgi:hypothetical protein